MELKFNIDGINLVFDVDADKKLRLLHCSSKKYKPLCGVYAAFQTEEFRAVEIQLSGENHDTGHGRKYVGTSEGKTLRYCGHALQKTEKGQELVLSLENDNMKVRLHYGFYGLSRTMTAYTEVVNRRAEPVVLEYVSSFCLYGLAKNKANDYSDLIFYKSNNTSYRENQWEKHTLADYGFYKGHRYSTAVQKIAVSNNGSWSTAESLPKALLHDRRCGEYMLFDIESNSSWCYEISEYQAVLYLLAAGGSLNETGWMHALRPGETYIGDKVVLCFADGLDEAFAASVRYKRLVRSPLVDKFADKIIFNPYMHNAGENPSEEQTLRDLEAVQGLGIDYYCIDAGWHDEEDYWKAIGEWKESRLRFPSGLSAVMQKIRESGFGAGLWIEAEMVGYFNEKKKELPDGCYFCRNKKPVANNGRLQLDFRSRKVRNRIGKVLNGIIGDYRAAYIKIDFNADCVAGTECRAASLGDGLKSASEAYYAFIKKFMSAHPDVMFENCASGGLRLDGKTQLVFPIHSTSDQTDYRLYPYIAGNMLANGAPEQMGVWCYPLPGQTAEQTVMNVANTALGRMQLSGPFSSVSGGQKEIIAEGIALHRKYAAFKRKALPVFPLGLNRWGGNTVAAGLKSENEALLVVWHFKGEEQVKIPLKKLPKNGAECVFPKFNANPFAIDPEKRFLEIGFAGEQARVFRLY